MATMTLALSLSGGDLPAAVARIMRVVFDDVVPHALRVDGEPQKPTASWMDDWLSVAQSNVSVELSDDDIFGPRLSFEPGRVIKFEQPETDRSMEPVIELLEEMPFQLATGLSIHQRAWRDAYAVENMVGFGGGHHALGWMCAFKGEGHERLVSPRWLEYGPWSLHEARGGLSVVQFHDLEATPEEALQQSRPGHRRMCDHDRGGFLHEPYAYEYELDGEYVPAERLLNIAAARNVSEREMLDACAMRHNQVLGDGRPIDRVAFVFDTEERAQAHLDALWLRGLECWWVDGRLDESYASVAPSLDWGDKP